MAEELLTAPETDAETKNKKKRPLRFKKWWLIAIPVVLIVLLLVSCLSRKGGSKTGENDYVTEAVEAHNIVKSLSGSGTLKPANSYTVTTLIEGDVLYADFEEGDVVEKDTVLYRIDSSDVSNNIERSQLSLNQAKRSYQDTLDGTYVKAPTAGTVYVLDVKVGDDVAAGQAIGEIRDGAVMTLKVPFPADDARRFFVGEAASVTLDSTFETLSGTVVEVSTSDNVGAGNMITRRVTIEVANPGGLTDTQYATASVGGVRCTGSALLSYRAKRTLTASGSGTVTEIRVPEGGAVVKNQIILALGGDDVDKRVQNASDSLRSSELAMENTQDQLDNYTVKSPIQGTIVDKQYKVGDTVETGKVLCTIYDLSYLEMTLNIDELDISSVRVGQSVAITADAVSGQDYVGMITKVSVAGTTTGGTTSYPVTIRIDETEGLLPGMNVDAEIMIAEADGVLAVPNEAVGRNGLVLITKNSPSAVRAEEQKAPDGYVYVKVETGVSDDKYVQILSGLQAGDTVAYIPAETGRDLMSMMMSGGNPHAAMAGGMGGGAPGGGGMVR